MINGISIIVPSRGRPTQLFQLIHSVITTARHPQDIQFCIGIDADDPLSREYLSQVKLHKMHFNLAVHVAYARTSSPIHLNTLCKQAAIKDLLLFTGDDTIFRTQFWDTVIYNTWNAYIDNIFVGYFNNGQDRRKCEHFILHKKWLELLGGEICPANLFQHFCIDMWVEEIATKLNRLTYFKNIVIEHMHPKYGKMKKDDTYEHVRRNISYAGTTMSIAERDTYIYHLPEQQKLREEQYQILQNHIDFYIANGA